MMFYLRIALSFGISFAIMGWWAWLAFANPDFTQQNLLTAFWPHYLGGLVIEILVLRFIFPQSPRG